MTVLGLFDGCQSGIPRRYKEGAFLWYVSVQRVLITSPPKKKKKEKYK